VDEDEAAAMAPPGREIVVVCAKGGASDYVAAILRERGHRAANLIDGMIAWGNYYRFQPVAETARYQIFQVNRVARGCLSYVIISQGEAAIIDPLRHVEEYRSFLAEKGATLALILDTHGHADHISGGPALAESSGAAYYLHPYDAIHPFDMLPGRLAYQMLHDGQTFQLGELAIQAIHAPGHTLGQVNFLATSGDGCSYTFTGDSVFVQSFGRPDLGGQGRAWAPLVYETIFGKLKASVPADSLVLAGHYASFAEADDAGVFGRRAADLWRENEALHFDDRQRFVAYVLDHLPAVPPQYIDIKRVNAGLMQVDEQQAGELELGKNLCALSDATATTGA
jgi:glyoxylase-like metal-dependent hydrolase (beta-lactamase superfamily II)